MSFLLKIRILLLYLKFLCPSLSILVILSTPPGVTKFYGFDVYAPEL